MNSWELITNIGLFGSLMWLGLYLLSRHPKKVLIWFSSLALICIALAYALNILNEYAFTIRLAFQLLRIEQLMIVLAALAGLAALITLAPRYEVWQERLQHQKTAFLMAWSGLIGFSLSGGYLVFTAGLEPKTNQLALMGFFLLLLGTAVTMIAAAEEGEAWLPHFFRSFDYTFFTALLFGGQVALIMIYAVGVTFALIVLLLGTITTAILVQVFSDPVQSTLDQIAFFNAPAIRRKRSELRAESGATQLLDNSLDLLAMADADFTKHTRRALSHMGNLPKLAANPLTNLPLIKGRLARQEQPDSTLVRASELKLVLTESIERLKPPGTDDFGTTDDWRHYNALYFPYVKGLRPYSRRTYYEENGAQDGAVTDALNWFREQVPERTLYNWQNAAAKLVARDLRERSLQAKNGQTA